MVRGLNQFGVLVFELVVERLVGIWSTKFMEEWTTDPEVSSPVWVCAVTLLQYIGKEKCQHSLRSEDDRAEHVLLNGLARRRLCVWCRPRHEVVGTFKRFQRIGAQPETKAIWIWKDRSTISEHGKLNRRESNEQTKFHSRCKNWRSRVSELLCTGTQHLNWSGHLLRQDWTVRTRWCSWKFHTRVGQDKRVGNRKRLNNQRAILTQNGDHLFCVKIRNVEKHNQTYQNKTRFGQRFFNSTLLDKETPEKTSIQKDKTLYKRP